MPQLEHIEAIEKRLWTAADTLRANSNYASNGWPGAKNKLNMPVIHNLRRDPFERYADKNWAVGSSDYMMSFFAREFWRFAFVQKRVAEFSKTAIEFPPMQKGASFNLEAVKDQIEAAVKSHHGQ
jgi:arylsulfatase